TDFFFWYAIGAAEDQFIPMFVKGPFYILGKGCKERIHSIRNDQGDKLGLLSLQSSGVSIYFISQLLDRFFYFYSIFFSYSYVIDHFGNSSQRHSGPGCNIFHGGGMRRGQDSSPPLKIHYYKLTLV